MLYKIVSMHLDRVSHRCDEIRSQTTRRRKFE